ncbi:MAG: hypothetical protein HYT21_00600 [Candidatus Nealsonbacteria bacterium]|nr:hypothetical protein [Candidatus Nealsonbacteria bacterium]
MEAEFIERPQSVSDFQRMFRYIYHALNEAEYPKDGDLIARLIEEITRLMEFARKDRRTLFKEQMANIFSWSMAVVNRLGIDPQEALWEKYPGVCPYCLREKDCICGTEHPIVENKELALRRFRRERADRRPQTLKDHQELHLRLYSWQHDRELPIVVAAHLVEEAGEVSCAYRRLGMANSDTAKNFLFNELISEMADVMSWMFALANRLDFDLSEAIWEYYPYECVKCQKGPCVCQEVI